MSTSPLLPVACSRVLLLSVQQGCVCLYLHTRRLHLAMTCESFVLTCFDLYFSILLYVTSVSFWWNPCLGPRRDADRAMVVFHTLWTVTRKTLDAVDMHLASICFFYSAGFYIYAHVGLTFYARRRFWEYTICHVVLHTLGAIGHVIFAFALQE